MKCQIVHFHTKHWKLMNTQYQCCFFQFQDMIHVANDENYDANDVSAGVSMSRTSRSCFNSTNGPTGTTTVPPSANVSIAQPSNLETIGDEKGAQNIRVINGNLAPPNQNRRFNRTSSPPQTPSFD